VSGSDPIRVRLSLPFPALNAGVRALLSADDGVIVTDDDAAEVQIMTPAVFMRQGEQPSPDMDLKGIVLLGAEGLEMSRLWHGSLSWGVLPLDVSAEELCAAVRAVAAGLIVGARYLLAPGEKTDLAPGPLTEREVQILGLLSRGLANKQIALDLGISEHTVKFHVSSIYARLNVANRTEAVREGLRNGWIAL